MSPFNSRVSGIVFTNVDMPGGLDGIMLAACIRDRWPPIKIIITCGKPLPVSAAVPAETVFFPIPTGRTG